MELELIAILANTAIAITHGIAHAVAVHASNARISRIESTLTRHLIEPTPRTPRRRRSRK